MAGTAKTRQLMVGTVAVGGDARVSVQSMTTTKTADVDGTLAQIYALAAAGADIVRCTCNEEEARDRSRADRAALAGADRRRHPLPVQARARRDRSGRAGVAPQPGQHPQARAHQARRARSQGPRPADPHRCQRRFARSRDGRAVRRHHARGARRVGDARARSVPRGRLRQREDRGEGVERAADDRLVPPALADDRSSAAPRCDRSRSDAAGTDQVGGRYRDAARGRHRRHDPLLAHRRSGRRGEGGQGLARVARACASARASISSRARRAGAPRST